MYPWLHHLLVTSTEQNTGLNWIWSNRIQIHHDADTRQSGHWRINPRITVRFANSTIKQRENSSPTMEPKHGPYELMRKIGLADLVASAIYLSDVDSFSSPPCWIPPLHLTTLLDHAFCRTDSYSLLLRSSSGSALTQPINVVGFARKEIAFSPPWRAHLYSPFCGTPPCLVPAKPTEKLHRSGWILHSRRP